MRWLHVPTLQCVVVAMLVTPMVASAEEAETFGCEANPTGDPIGGGEGY